MIGDIFRLIFWRYLITLFASLPLSVLNSFIDLLTHLQIALWYKRRNILSRELRKSGLLNKDIDHNRLIYQSFKSNNSRLLKKCLLPKINNNNIDKFLQVDGLKHLEEAIKRGKGTILLNPHFGPYLFVLPALGHRGYSLNQIALQGVQIKKKHKVLNKLIYYAKFDSIEGRMPITFLNAAKNPMIMRTAIEILAKNGIILFASTGRGGKSWHEVDFLGRKSTFNLIPFKLGIKMGAALLPVFALNSKPIARIVIEKPLIVLDGDSPVNILEQYISKLSWYVMKYPDHFAIFLYEMRIKAGRDDHPFFTDYAEKL